MMHHGLGRGWRAWLLPGTLVVGVVLAGCGSSANKSPSTGSTKTAAAIQPPSSLAKSGQLVFCSDISYPPEEFYQGTTPIGSDIEIATEAARRMGLKAVFDNTGFDGIIAALLSHKCDAIISGMNDTPQRRKAVDFVDYLSVGQSVIVRKGNPLHIHSLADLAGHSVGAQIGTTNFQFLQSYSKKLQAQGKPPISPVAFKEDTDGANALSTGKVDAYETDSPVEAYYVKKNPSAFEFAIPAINPIPVGIAIRKNETQLKSALMKAINAMYADGTMRRILSKWQMTKFMLKSR